MCFTREQEELQAEWNAREDYLSEAFGAEARTLAAQAADDAEFYEKIAIEEGAAAAGLSVEEFEEAHRVSYFFSQLTPWVNPADEVPF